MTTFTIIGAGMMGTAMCWPLVDNGHTVRLVGTPLDEEIIASIKSNRVHPKLERRIPDGVTAYAHTELAEAMPGTNVIIGGISSFGVDWFAHAIAAIARPEVPVLSITKGLEVQANGDLLILPEALDRKMPPELRGKISFNAVGGPCIAHELPARRHTGVVFTGKDERILRQLRDLLATPYYHISVSTDMLGVEVCAAMKNAYAMGVGLAVGWAETNGPDGLGQNYNPQAALFGQSCLEMRRLVEILGGGANNVSNLPGSGDLYVTVFGGRTVRLGKMLGQNVPFSKAREILAGVTLESVEIITRVVSALPLLEQRGLARQEHFPFLLHMHEIIHQDAPVNIPWDKFYNEN